MVNLKRFDLLPLAMAVTAAAICATARAEYRCDAPATPEDDRACALARTGSPDGLRQFIQRTQSVYGLYFYDYVREADIDRWSDSERHEGSNDNLATNEPDHRVVPAPGQ